MSRMLLFSHAAAWSAARAHADAGRATEALAKIATVLSCPDLPVADAIAANQLAGELHLKSGRFAKARRHLLAASKLDPANATLHHLLGIAFQDDPYGCDLRAARRFRKACELAPENAIFRASYGLALVRVNRVKSGIEHLEVAAKLAPTDATVLGTVVAGYREADLPRRGLKVVSHARFIAPEDATIRRLWDRVRFDVAQAEQRQSSPEKRRGTLKFLPFLRVNSTSSGTGTGGVVRRDLGTRPTPHLNRLRAYGDRA